MHSGFPESIAEAVARLVIGLALHKAFVQFARFDHSQLAVHLMDLTSGVGNLHDRLLSDG